MKIIRSNCSVPVLLVIFYVLLAVVNSRNHGRKGLRSTYHQTVVSTPPFYPQLNRSTLCTNNITEIAIDLNSPVSLLDSFKSWTASLPFGQILIIIFGKEFMPQILLRLIHRPNLERGILMPKSRDFSEHCKWREGRDFRHGEKTNVEVVVPYLLSSRWEVAYQALRSRTISTNDTLPYESLNMVEVVTSRRIGFSLESGKDEGVKRICVPLKKGFTDKFVAAEKFYDDHTNKYVVTGGFSVEVFHAILQVLPFRIEPIFVPYIIDKSENEIVYNNLLEGIPSKDYDIVVGDITILADRASLVDFPIPYLDSKVFMIVHIEHEECKSMWVFMKPFSPELWLMISINSIFVGLAIVFLERRVNNREFEGPLHQQFFPLLWLPMSMLVFQERVLANKWSKVVLVIWFYVAFILMQSYGSNLSSILIAGQVVPVLPKTLRYVGYQEGSFVKELLVKQLNFSESQLKPYSTMEEYDKALSSGSLAGGVDAIYDELPYINLFLREPKYNCKYTMVGPIYDTAGFGFGFPVGSPLLPHFSRAILNITESPKMKELKEKYFGAGYSSQSKPSCNGSSNPGLGSYSFIGLFLMTWAVTILVIICSEYSLRMTFINQRPSPFRMESNENFSTEMITVVKESSIIDNQDRPPPAIPDNGELAVDRAAAEEEEEVEGGGVHSS